VESGRGWEGRVGEGGIGGRGGAKNVVRGGSRGEDNTRRGGARRGGRAASEESNGAGGGGNGWRIAAQRGLNSGLLRVPIGTVTGNVST